MCGVIDRRVSASANSETFSGSSAKFCSEDEQEMEYEGFTKSSFLQLGL